MKAFHVRCHDADSQLYHSFFVLVLICCAFLVVHAKNRYFLLFAYTYSSFFLLLYFEREKLQKKGTGSVCVLLISVRSRRSVLASADDVGLLTITSGVIYFIIFSMENYNCAVVSLSRRNAIVRRVVLVLALLGCLCPPTIFTSSLGKCPKKCICDLDIGGLYMTRCVRANLREWPTNDIDRKMEIIEIENPSHVITIAHHIFDGLKDLKILRIRNSGVPAVGMVRMEKSKKK
jgi:hypothetical protein